MATEQAFDDAEISTLKFLNDWLVNHGRLIRQSVLSDHVQQIGGSGSAVCAVFESAGLISKYDAKAAARRDGYAYYRRTGRAGLVYEICGSVITALRGVHDTKSDKPKKSVKKRSLSAKGGCCIAEFKKRRRVDPSTTMISVVEDHVGRHGGSVTSIMRVLNDNADKWKPKVP